MKDYKTSDDNNQYIKPVKVHSEDCSIAVNSRHGCDCHVAKMENLEKENDELKEQLKRARITADSSQDMAVLSGVLSDKNRTLGRKMETTIAALHVYSTIKKDEITYFEEFSAKDAGKRARVVLKRLKKE